MKTKHLLILITIISFSNFLFAQEAKQSESDNQSKAKFVKTTKLPTNQPQSNPPKNIDNSDGYMGLREKILKRLIVPEIPADFPKYEEGMGAEQYKLIIKEWAKKNKHLVTEEAKRKYKARNAKK